jgi:NitT/TauT family transport system permease protein
MFMVRQPLGRHWTIALNILSVVLLFVAYISLEKRQKGIEPDDTTVPNLTQFQEGWTKMWERDIDGTCWIVEDAKTTFGRHAIGLGIGAFAAIIIGIAMAAYPVVEGLWLVPLSFFKSVPGTAMLVIFFVIVGTDEPFFICMIVFGVLPVLTLGIYASGRNDVAMNTIYKAYTLGFSTPEVIHGVMFKQIMPRIIDLIRLSIGPAMIFLIAAEVYTGNVGFGYRMRIQSRMLNMNIVYIYLFILGAVLLIADYVLLFLRKRIAPWFGD